MIGKRIIEEKAIPLAEAKRIIEKREKEVEELGYEQRLTLDHLRKFCRTDEKTAKSIIDEILKMEKFKLEHAVNVADLMPENEDEVRSIFAKERFALTKDEINEVLKIVSKYR